MEIPLFSAFRSEKIEQNCLNVLKSGFIASGPYVQKFTDRFAELVESKASHVVTTNDMSTAIQIALHISGVREGDEVLTTSFSCMSTNAPIGLVKAKAVWVDMDPATLGIDLDSLIKSITEKSKVLILYHVAGYPGPVEEVSKICKEKGIVLIEDCNNALLATTAGQQCGQWGDFAIYSFYPNRLINAGEGGALVCKNKSDAERALLLRRYGINSRTFRDEDGEINPHSDIPEIGWAAILNNMCSAMGYAQLDNVSQRVDRIRQNANEFNFNLSSNKKIIPIEVKNDSQPSYWVYMIRSQKRDQLMKKLKLSGIGCSKIHQLNHIYSGFKSAAPTLLGSQEIMATILGIPCGWWLSHEDHKFISKSINEAF